MRKTVMISFRRDQIPRILELSGKKVDKKGYIVDKKTKERVICFECQTEIKAGELGNVMPGSSDVFLCDNPICFAKYADEKELV